MKLYTSVGPNPRVVNVFAAELGMSLDQETIDIMAGENRQAAYKEINPGAQSPALMLDDGSVVSEECSTLMKTSRDLFFKRSIEESLR